MTLFPSVNPHGEERAKRASRTIEAPLWQLGLSSFETRAKGALLRMRRGAQFA
jgi:hypothetical protein